MKPSEVLRKLLDTHGWRVLGGGNGFDLYGSSSLPALNVYVFDGVAGDGPDTTHWAVVSMKNGPDNFVSGGFGEHTLKCWLTSQEN